MNVKLIVSIIIGAILGWLGARYIFVGSSLSLIPWAIAGLAIGVWSDNKKTASLNGALYGFSLAFIFMIAGYNGTAPATSHLLFFAGLGLVGAVCGCVLALIANWIRPFFNR